MPSKLQQLEIGYNPVEDRLILRIHTSDLAEYRFWLTRRVTKALWDILMKLLGEEQKNSLQRNQEIQKVDKDFEDEKSKKQPLASKFAQKVSTTPLGPNPILISRIAAQPGEKGTAILQLQSEDGKSIELNVDHYIMLSLCKLMSETMKATQWNLDLSLN